MHFDTQVIQDRTFNTAESYHSPHYRTATAKFAKLSFDENEDGLVPATAVKV